MRSNFFSAASAFPASVGAFSRTAAGRAGQLARAAIQVLRHRSRFKVDVGVAAAVALAGMVAGLAAVLAPSAPGGQSAVASDTARAPRAVTRTSGPADGTTDAQQAIQIQPADLQASAQQSPAGKQSPAKQSLAKQAAKPAKHAAPARPYQMYDSVTPSAIPAGHPVATYATGNYAVSPSQVSGKQVIWIDTNGSAPTKASVLDVEPGDVTPAVAATWAQARLSADPHADVRIYTMLSQWDATKAAIATLPGWMQTHVKWWIADPTGVPHVVPGSSATQWYWGPSYDISTVNPGF